MIEACPTCFAYAFSEIQATIEEYYFWLLQMDLCLGLELKKKKYTRVGMHVGLSLNIFQIRGKV